MVGNRLLNCDQVETAIKAARDLGMEYSLEHTEEGVLVVYTLTTSHRYCEYVELCRRLKNHGLEMFGERFVDEPLGTSAEEPIGEITVMIPTTASE